MPKHYTISKKKRPKVLSVAGFDPCGGAGVLADIKTFEEHKVYGLSVITSNTIQVDSEFYEVFWVDDQTILKSIAALFDSYDINVVKIGLVRNEQSLKSIVDLILAKNDMCKIIWDPVIKASSGFEFHKVFDLKKHKQIFLITPNLEELDALDLNKEVLAKEVLTNTLVKGGHASAEELGQDLLYTPDGRTRTFKATQIANQSKHGTGCVLSSAIAANLALGISLERSCLRAKTYINKFLHSNYENLGYHKR
ncbi:MAG: hydroxymethylpyrimidine/phosphomethylpyrimidine kinase [Flavobacteriales bacterium]|nr:hydroxymethylpyrimidine/phosphomethylpyrimidine kinase [Flavobacteriales bacterium]